MFASGPITGHVTLWALVRKWGPFFMAGFHEEFSRRRPVDGGKSAMDIGSGNLLSGSLRFKHVSRS
jgi:hypothetical protein